MTDCDFGEGKPDLQEGPWQIQASAGAWSVGWWASSDLRVHRQHSELFWISHLAFVLK